VRAQLHRAAKTAGVRRRFAPHQPRHHAVEMTREGIPLLASPAGPATLALAVAPATATI
jgi:hypothetical protein